MQIQMAHLCLLPQEWCHVQMSSGETRAEKATSSPQEFSIQTVIGHCRMLSVANSCQIVHLTVPSATCCVTVLSQLRPVFILSQMSLFKPVGVCPYKVDIKPSSSGI